MSIIKKRKKYLDTEKLKIENHLKNINNEILLLQKECLHKNDDESNSMIYHSTDMVDDFYKCTICGVIKKMK